MKVFSIWRSAVALLGLSLAACESATQEDNYQFNHAIIRGVVRQASGELVSGAEVSLFGFANRACGALAESVPLGQATTSAQGTYQIDAKGIPSELTTTMCITARARLTAGSQTKERMVSGTTVQFVAADARPDTATIDIVLPP